MGLLEGITRQIVMRLLDRERIPWAEQTLWPIDLHRADEAFLTSSVRGVVPVSRADGEPIGDGKPGPITRRVMQTYDALVQAATRPQRADALRAAATVFCRARRLRHAVGGRCLELAPAATCSPPRRPPS